MKRHLFGKWFLLFSVVSIIACSCEKSESYPGQTQETDVLPVATAAPCESDTYTPVISSYKRRELVIDPDNLSTADHISLYHSYGPLQELLLDEEQITDFTLADLLHAMQLTREEAKAAADSVLSGVWIDVDMLYDRYDDLLKMQEEEKLYPVEIDMLCWGEVEELPQDPKEISYKDYTDLAPGEDPPPWQ